MLWPELYLTSLGTHLPERVRTEDAVGRGDYDADELADTELLATCVASADESAPEMAVSAALRALCSAGRPAADIRLVLYAHLYHQGQDFWGPAGYVSRHVLGGSTAPCIHVQQASNGGMAALELAACYLTALGAGAALVVTADRYMLPGFDRWRSDVGQVYSDGATAAVLSTDPGFARIIVTHSTTDPELEELTRNTDWFSSVAHEMSTTLDLRTLKRRFLDRVGHDKVFDALASGVIDNVAETLNQAGLTMADIARVVVPNVGRELLDWEFLEPLKITVERTVWDWGRTVSHLGAGDQVAGLDRLLRTGSVAPGDRVLLVGAGLGFNWTSAVVEIVAMPA